jgi:hypothetical protein
MRNCSWVSFCYEGEVSEAVFADDFLASMARDFNAMKTTATAQGGCDDQNDRHAEGCDRGRKSKTVGRALSRLRFLLVKRARRPPAQMSKINNLRVRQSD